MLAQFIAMIREQVDKAIYVWGGQGEVATEDKIRRMETSTTNANRAIKLLNARKAQGIEPLMFDCSGLAIWPFQKLRLISYDTTAEGLRRLCEPTTSPRVGDLAFSAFDSRGQAQHMGIVTKPDTVTEARGRDYGVVDSPLSRFVSFGKNPFIKGESMLQRGDKGEAVYDLQSLYKELGYDIGTWANMYNGKPDGRDGSFGGHMDTLTKEIQKEFGLEQTGVVDAALYGKLVIKLIARHVSDGSKDAHIADLTADLAATKNLLLVEQNTNNRLSNDLYAVKETVNKVVDAIDVISGLNRIL